ncbi:MAG: DUF485 domain-containing protein [Candidatus Hydrogenedentes bacterium]|nr:DUF485 domain-containing protein [Candidatus Hydrogenedentota bacterium]
MHYHEDHSHVVNRNARYGLILFAIYVALYGGFVFLAVFRTEVMGAIMPGGANLAIAYGFALIGAALALALVYVFLCGKAVPQSAAGDAEQKARNNETESH